MRNISVCISLILLFPLLFGCQKENENLFEKRIENITKEELQSIEEFLGNDLLEGRAPGTRGGNLAEIYVRSLYKILNFQAGNNNSFFQTFTMTGFSNEGFTANAGNVHLKYLEDMVGTFSVKKDYVDLTKDLVYVGFGITTDIWDWDDYKDIDVKDKIVVSRVNDPGIFNDSIFEGNTLTYFGRWTYHIEEAAKRGAAGIILIHTSETAGYDWNVVQNSWSGEELYIDSDLDNNLKFRGWIKENSFKKILNENGFNIEDLYAESESKDFQPVDLGIKIQFNCEKNIVRSVSNNNVIAHIPGKTEERIILSAHIDHLGKDKINNGDNIYNGAIDNGTAVASMILTAKILKEFQKELHYSITLLACNAEESGLLGSKYFIQNTDKENIIANINFESTPVWQKSKSIMGIGARFSNFEDLLKELAQQNNINYSYFSLSNQGLFYRSDQFSFAKYGIPAVWISAGEDEINGEKNYTEFWNKNYHTVNDEFDPNWPLEGMKQTIKYALLLIEKMNKEKLTVRYNSDLPFPIE